MKPASTAAIPLRLKRPLNSSRPKKRLDILTLNPTDTIDESTLLQPQDYTKPIIQPPECAPAPGKRRKACKDCTCGLRELEEAENAQARKLPVVLLQEDELDFTVQGKTSSCGSCGLGDAFRCAGCTALFWGSLLMKVLLLGCPLLSLGRKSSCLETLPDGLMIFEVQL